MSINRFPTSLGSGGARYVFFSSLLDSAANPNRSNAAAALARKTAYMGINYLTQSTEKGEAKLDTIENKIQQVLLSLKAIADAQYAKEKAYIAAQKKKINSSIFDIAFPSTSEGDWSEFITLLNFARGNEGTFFKDVKEELARIEENIQYMKDIDKKIQKENPSAQVAKKWRQGYRRTKQYQTTEYLVPLVKQLFGTERSGKNSYVNVIKDYIIQQNWDKFLSQNGGRLDFDSASFNALVFASVQIVVQELVKNANLRLEDIFQGQKTYEGMMEAFRKWMSSEKNQELAGIKKINGILDSPFAKKMIAESFKKKLQIIEKEASQEEKQKRKGSARNKNARNKNARKLVSQIDMKGYQNEKEIKDKLADLITGGQWLKVNSSLYQPSGNWLITEISQLIPIRNGQINVSLGSSSIKADNLFIETTLEINEALFEKIERKTQDAFKDSYSSFENSPQYYDGDISTANWLERQRKLANYKKELSQILLEQKNIQDLSESFIVETSDKIYESFGAKANAFDGGSLGPNLMSQLAKIDELAATGGMSLGDLDWLRSAIINSHKSTVVGAGMKTSLENYLSMIAVALLFDDGKDIMIQATQNIKQAVSSTTVNTIHLFFLQGFGYFPLSQVLYSIYNKLSKSSQEIFTIAKGGGAKVKISLKGYPKDLTPYENLSIETWEETGAAAESGALINMTFLASFMDILKDLQPGI